MEPMLPRDGEAGLTDLAVELVAKASYRAGQVQRPVRERRTQGAALSRHSHGIPSSPTNVVNGATRMFLAA